MTFFEKLKPYTDGYGLVSPKIVDPPGTLRASDNGVLFTAQALILNANEEDLTPYVFSLKRCVDSTGTLHRAPDDTSLDAPDDHYGILSLYAIHKDLSTPVKPRWVLLLQPVLLYLYLATYSSFLSTIGTILLSPLVAIIMALSNVNEDPNNTSNKLLSWTICQALKHRGWLPAVGARFWEWRMKKIYGSIHTLFVVYFPTGHPFLNKV